MVHSNIRRPKGDLNWRPYPGPAGLNSDQLTSAGPEDVAFFKAHNNNYYYHSKFQRHKQKAGAQFSLISNGSWASRCALRLRKTCQSTWGYFFRKCSIIYISMFQQHSKLAEGVLPNQEKDICPETHGGYSAYGTSIEIYDHSTGKGFSRVTLCPTIPAREFVCVARWQ